MINVHSDLEGRISRRLLVGAHQMGRFLLLTFDDFFLTAPTVSRGLGHGTASAGKQRAQR